MYSVLLVDPNQVTINETSKLIHSCTSNFRINASVSQFDKALQLLNDQYFSLVIINMRNYNSSGLVLCSRIRQHSQIPIILLGGKNDFRLARKALTYQISDYLTEPIQKNLLASSINAVKKKIEKEFFSNTLVVSATTTKKGNNSAKAVIDTVKRYVQSELRHNITLKQISRELHFNSAYLGQKFKLYEKMSFNEYLLQQRMEKAKQLLKKTDLKIYEIANEIGYSEIDWFYKKFKEYTGFSANEYRKKYELSRAN